MNYSILPKDKRFDQLLIPYLIPYMLYVGLESIPKEYLAIDLKQVVKFVAVSIALIVLRKNFCLKKTCFRDFFISLVSLPLLLAVWILPLYFFTQGKKADQETFSTLYIVMRAINSTILVALFEELFIRAFLLEWFYQADDMVKEKGIPGALSKTMELNPKELSVIPFCKLSLILSTILFAIGHTTVEYIPAILYFSATNFIYYKTKSFWTCIFTHALTNLAIAGLVAFCGMNFLW